MGQCLSRFNSRQSSSNKGEAPGSALANREHLGESRETNSESTEADAGGQLDAVDKNNKQLQADQSPVDIEIIVGDLLKELEAIQVGDDGKPVILPNDVKKIWDRPYYRRIYTSQIWYNSSWDKTNFMDHFVRIMSILVLIGFDKWERFGAIFVDWSHRRDGNLPFDKETLQEINFLDKQKGHLFHKEQFSFCPIPIPQQEDEFILDEKSRLPWINRPEIIGEGAFGKVTKRTVAEGFLHYQNTNVNSKATAVAIKTLSDKDARNDEFKDELKNLKQLRECLSDHKRIMVNLVTMVDKSSQGNIYHIVYELAAYDLNVFLTHMPRNLRAKRHATASPERTDSKNMWPGDLISESVNLADALDYLHNRLYTKSHTSLKSHVSLSHNDIKAENILVVYPDTTNKHDRFPVGQWKFADFGLSVVKVKRTSGCYSKHLSAGEAAWSPSHPQKTHRTERPSSVSMAMPARHPGQYTAPELDQTNPQLEDCRSADVWSFGCVLSEIVTYAVKLDCQLVKDFRESLGKSEKPDQPDPRDHRFYDHESKDIKPQFLNHLAKLSDTAHGDKRILGDTRWIGSCVELIREIVVKEPSRRLKAGKIRAKLSEIDVSMRDEKKEWLDHCDFVSDPSNLDAEPELFGQASAGSQNPMEFNDSDNTGDDALTRVPSFCFHPAEL